jgi:hypothetical protein
LLIEAKTFSRLTLINFLAVLRRLLYFSMIASQFSAQRFLLF